MNNELQSKILEWMNGLEKAGTKAIEFGSGQLPELLQQVVTYGVIKHSTMTLLGAALLVFGVYCVRRGRDEYRSDQYSSGEILYFILATLSFLFGIILMIDNMDKALMAAFAPKLYIVEYLRALVK